MLTAPSANLTMKVKIWSDVVCPYCYIGKREFERALADFPHRDQVEVVWKSFELDRDAPERSTEKVYAHLANKYGRTLQQAKEMVAGVVERARTLGLAFNMDKAIRCNSFHAHRMIHFAGTKGKADVAKERLFQAHFVLGEPVSDRVKLKEIADSIGLDGAEAEQVLHTAAFADEVRADEVEASQIGVRGVPFFVLDDRYAVSGAQPAAHFQEALQRAWEERVRA
jgi:predicted DsbA family dithiol-disulfide isomerase